MKRGAPETVTCDECRKVTAKYDREALKRAGWLEMARAGKRVEHYPWRCPACNPQLRASEAGPGLTTGRFGPSKPDPER